MCLCRQFEDVGDAVIRRQHFAIVGTHGPAHATPLHLWLHPHSNQRRIGGHRREVRRLLPGLNVTGQQSLWDVAQKASTSRGSFLLGQPIYYTFCHVAGQSGWENGEAMLEAVDRLKQRRLL